MLYLKTKPSPRQAIASSVQWRATQKHLALFLLIDPVLSISSRGK